MFEIKVTLNASPEFIGALNLLTSAMSGKITQPEPIAIAEPKLETEKAPVKKAPKQAAPAPEAKAETAEAPQTNKAISIEDVRAAVSALSTAGKREEVKALLQEFECNRVPDLPESRFSEFIERLTAI